MKIYIYSDYPYHDNETIYGVFDSREKALRQAEVDDWGSWSIVECEMNTPNEKGWPICDQKNEGVRLVENGKTLGYYSEGKFVRYEN